VTSPNPNWPLVSTVVDFTQGPPNLPGVNAMAIDNQSRRNTVRKIQTQRGRQYELDQVQAGTATIEVTDPLEYLNPQNTSSPYNTGGNTITSYRCVQIGAWWNTATNDLTGNLLNTANPIPGQPWLGGLGASAPYGYDPSFENWSVYQRPSPSGTSIVSGLPTTPLNANTGFESGIAPWVASFCTASQSSTQKHSGSFSCKIVPSGTDPTADLASELVTVVPGRQYTITAWVWCTVAVTNKCDLALVWFDSGGNSLGASIQTAVSIPATTWTQVTYTATAPAGAATTQMHVQMQGTQPASNILYVDDVSLTNFAYPVDSTYQVWAMTFNSFADTGGWRPRYVAGHTYTIQCDVWAASGFQVQIAWNGTTFFQQTITGNGAYQTMTLTFTPTAADVANGARWYLTPASASWSTYPETIYVSKIVTQGPVAGFVTSGSPTMSYTPVSPFTGLYSLALSMTSGTDSVSLPLATVPGYQYTFSAYLLVQNTGSGLGATQTILGSSTPTTVVGTYQRLVQTFTAIEAVTMVKWQAASTPYPAVIYVDAVQLELASTASAYTPSGPTFFPLYTGYVERFPMQWDMQGTRGIRPLTAVDALAVLSRTEITQAYSTTLLADTPSAYAPLNDAALPQVVQQPQGGFTINGYTQLGNSGQVSFGGDTFLDGTPAVSIAQQNSDPPITGDPTYATYLGTTNGGIPFNPQAFTLEMWVKPTSGTIYAGAASMEPGETTSGEALGPNQRIGLYTQAGKILGSYADAGGASFTFGFPGWSGFPDGNWHHVAIVLPGSNQVHLYCDGVPGGIGTFVGSPLGLSLDNLFIDATTYFGDTQTIVAVANMAVYNYALTDAQLLNHYNRGIGYKGEVSGARVLRLLKQYWSSNVIVAAGFRAMAEDYDYATRFMLDVLQEIQETERGLIYVDRAGIVNFDDSTSRYINYPASTVTFGENPAGASPVEYPYQDLQLDYDPTYTFSQTNLTRPGNGNFQPLPNPLPANPPYGQRILSQEVMVITDADLVQISTFYLARYGAPVVRVDALTLNPAANPAMFSKILGLELGQRITVKRRTSAGLTTSNDYYVEQISHNIDAYTSTWTMTLQCSPVFNNNAWICGDSTNGVLGTTTIPVY
jgi:hypothetical protein